MISSANAAQPNQRALLIEGAAFGVMVGAAESFLGAYAVEIGIDDVQMAVLLTVPLLVAALAQLLWLWSGWGWQRQRPIVVAGAAVQAFAYVVLAMVASGHAGFISVLSIAVVLTVAGQLALNVSNAWLSLLTENADRTAVLAHRQMVIQLAVLIGFACGGMWLQVVREYAAEHINTAFVALFVIGGVARLCSAWWWSRQPEVILDVSAHAERTELRHIALRVPLTMVVFAFGAWVAIPSFTPYSLRVLQLDFASFMMIYAITNVMKALTLPLWRRLGLRIGAEHALALSLVLVALTAAAWTLPTHLPGLFAAQVLSGVAWAGLELYSAVLLAEAAPPQQRNVFYAGFGAASAVAQVGGALLGAKMLQNWDVGYPFVFMVSSFLRASPLLVLWGARGWRGRLP
jgi:MFS family permease